MTDQEGGGGSLAEPGASPAGLAWLLGGGGGRGRPTACPFTPISLPGWGEEAAGTRPRAGGLWLCVPSYVESLILKETDSVMLITAFLGVE